MTKLFLALSFSIPIYYFIFLTTLGLFWNGYSPISDSMSELGAVNSPVKDLMNYGGFMMLGIAMVCFAGVLQTIFQSSWLKSIIVLFCVLAGVGMVSVSFFPCDVNCVDVTRTSQLHSIISSFPAILLPLAAIFSARLYGQKEHIFNKNWQLGSFVAGLLSLTSGPIIAMSVFPSAEGFVQRLGIGLSLAWMSLSSLRLLQKYKGLADE